MALTVTVTPGKQFAPTEGLTAPRLNQLGQPTFTVTGTVGTSEIADASVTGAKTVPSTHFYTSTVSFSAGIYTLTYTPTPTIADGTIIAFKANAGNTTAALGTQLTIGASTKKLFKNRTETLVSGDIVINQIVEARYDSAGDSGAGAWQMLSQLASVPQYYTASATGTNDYTLALTPPVAHGVAIGDLEGKPIRFKVPNTNTGAVRITVQIGGITLAQKKLSKFFNVPLIAGDLTLNQIAEIVWESSSDGYQLQSLPGQPLREVSVPSLARDLIVQSNTVTSKLDIVASDIVLRDTNQRLYLAQTVALTVDISGGSGVVNGTDAAAAAGWWYLWVIYNGTTVAGVLSTSSSNPNLTGGLSGYTYKALIGAAFATSSSVFAAMYQAGQDVWVNTNVVFTAKGPGVANTYEVLAGADLTAFRNAVPPIARMVSGNLGATTTAGAITVAACKSDGTVDAANTIGAQAVQGITSGITFDTFVTAGTYRVPIRGGTGSYNIQWKADAITARYRLTVTGYSL